jgi:hemoglobin-like flavoprotein
MTAEQIRRLRKSFHLVERKAELAAPYFYQQLFALDAGLCPLFKTDIELQAMKLMGMLQAALDLADEPTGMIDMTLHDLGARLADYGLRPRHYATVGTALTAMLETVLGEEFSRETRQAWMALYHMIAGKMLSGVAHAAAA